MNLRYGARLTVSEEYLRAASGTRDRFIRPRRAWCATARHEKEVDVSLDKLQPTIDQIELQHQNQRLRQSVRRRRYTARLKPGRKENWSYRHYGAQLGRSGRHRRIARTRSGIMFPNFRRNSGRETLKEARKSDIGVIAMKPLMAGISNGGWRCALCRSGVTSPSPAQRGRVERNASVLRLTPLTDAELEKLSGCAKSWAIVLPSLRLCAPCTWGSTSDVIRVCNYLRSGLADWRRSGAAMGSSCVGLPAWQRALPVRPSDHRHGKGCRFW